MFLNYISHKSSELLEATYMRVDNLINDHKAYKIKFLFIINTICSHKVFFFGRKSGKSYYLVDGGAFDMKACLYKLYCRMLDENCVIDSG